MSQNAPNRRTLLLSLVAVPLSLSAAFEVQAAKQPTGEILVQMRRFRNSKGKVRIGLYRKEEDWPKAGRAFQARVLTLQKRSLDVTFKNLPFGTYAVAVLHDEDGDGDMDYSIIGVPTEGFGFSRDAEVRFGPPDFDDAKIELKKAKQRSRIKIRYML